MIIFKVILSCLVIDRCTSKSLDKVTKAASPLTNCGCQCSSLTFRDSSNTIQGNCKTVDGTGAQWCYVDSSLSTCQDLVPSSRFPHNPWSYEACATPPLGSYACPSHSHSSHHHHPAAPTDVIVSQGTPAFPIGPPIVQGSHPRGPPANEGAQGPPFIQSGLPQGPPVTFTGQPQGPPVAASGPQGPPNAQGGVPLGPAGVDTFPEGDEPQAPEAGIDVAGERGIFG